MAGNRLKPKKRKLRDSGTEEVEPKKLKVLRQNGSQGRHGLHVSVTPAQMSDRRQSHSQNGGTGKIVAHADPSDAQQDHDDAQTQEKAALGALSLLENQDEGATSNSPAPKKKKKKKEAWQGGTALSQRIPQAGLEQQAQWLWDSYAASTRSTLLERAGLNESSMLGLEGGIPLEQLLASLADGVGQQLSQMDVESKGSPIALIITASAGGANDLAKRLPGLNKACRIGKLFAKHFKIEEQRTELLSRCVNVAVGTPNRMAKLAEDRSLKLERLKLVLIDCAIDAKQRTILDVPEVCKDLWAFFQSHIKARAASGAVKIALLNSSAL